MHVISYLTSNWCCCNGCISQRVFFARQINSWNNMRNDFAVIQRTIWLSMVHLMAFHWPCCVAGSYQTFTTSMCFGIPSQNELQAWPSSPRPNSPQKCYYMCFESFFQMSSEVQLLPPCAWNVWIWKHRCGLEVFGPGPSGSIPT